MDLVAAAQRLGVDETTRIIQKCRSERLDRFQRAINASISSLSVAGFSTEISWSILCHKLFDWVTDQGTDAIRTNSFTTFFFFCLCRGDCDLERRDPRPGTVIPQCFGQIQRRRVTIPRSEPRRQMLSRHGEDFRRTRPPEHAVFFADAGQRFRCSWRMEISRQSLENSAHAVHVPADVT